MTEAQQAIDAILEVCAIAGRPDLVGMALASGMTPRAVLAGLIEWRRGGTEPFTIPLVGNAHIA